MKVGIVKLSSSGNFFSLMKAIKVCGHDPIIVDSAKKLGEIDLVLLPGVGSFQQSMKYLNEFELKDMLVHSCARKPVLAICLGMQILATKGMEGSQAEMGLNIIPGTVDKLPEVIKRPHIGYRWVDFQKSWSSSAKYYFMHSYHYMPDSDIHVAGTFAVDSLSNLVAVVAHENIVGVQFHPEKSKSEGLKFLNQTLEKLFDVK